MFKEIPFVFMTWTMLRMFQISSNGKKFYIRYWDNFNFKRLFHQSYRLFLTTMKQRRMRKLLTSYLPYEPILNWSLLLAQGLFGTFLTL